MLLAGVLPLFNQEKVRYSTSMLQRTTTQATDLFQKALVGNNYSERTIRAYGKDVEQFLGFVKKLRADWDNPLHFSRVDIVEFFNRRHTDERPADLQVV